MEYVLVTSCRGLLICNHSSHQASNKQGEEHNTTELWKQLRNVCEKHILKKGMKLKQVMDVFHWMSFLQSVNLKTLWTQCKCWLSKVVCTTALDPVRTRWCGGSHCCLTARRLRVFLCGVCVSSQCLCWLSGFTIPRLLWIVASRAYRCGWMFVSLFYLDTCARDDECLLTWLISSLAQ